MPADLAELFDDWAARLARGETPDPLAYLEQAGEGRDELARLMDAFLQSAPRREPDAETVELARAWVAGASPLAELRARKGIRRDDLVDGIVAEFGLAAAKRALVKRYYHRLEAGAIDAAGLSPALLGYLARRLEVAAETLLAWRARPLAASPAFRTDAHQTMVQSETFELEEDDEEVRNLFHPGR